ncbi:MAG TPA: ABC transporter permease [Anaerolineae bacterium]|nr:ABC transporter permease [Anaerolineae bacterium]
MTSRREIENRQWLDWAIPFLTAVLAVVAAFAVGALFIIILGADPVEAYKAILVGAFGNVNALTETAIKAAPLVITAAGLAIVFRANIWNIGAEGQLFMGGLAAAWVALTFGDQLPPAVIIPLTLIAGFVGGAMWGFIPAILKVRLGIDEIINTIMLNYIAILLVNWIIHGPLQDPTGGFPRTSIFPDSAHLPILIPRTRLHLGVLVAIAVGLLLQFVLWRVSFGYRVRAVGDNKEAAAYGGIKVGRVIVTSMVISGGLAGIAGMIQVTGLHFRMLEDISGGIGFTAIAVALLANNQPIITLVTALLLAGLDVGANAMQYQADVPVAVVSLIQGLVILFVVAREFISRRLIARRRTMSEMLEHRKKADDALEPGAL